MPMKDQTVECRICGDVVDPRRIELGYDYCLKPGCQERGIKRVTLASVAVNKAADYITSADELVRAPAAPAISVVEEVEEVEGTRGAPVRAARTPTTKKMPSTLEQLREAEARLHDALTEGYERFERGDITAREMERESDGLVDRFNRLVRSENIRYRSMLRPRPARGRSSPRQ